MRSVCEKTCLWWSRPVKDLVGGAVGLVVDCTGNGQVHLMGDVNLGLSFLRRTIEFSEIP